MDTRRNGHFFKYLPFHHNDTLWQLYCTTVGHRNIPPGTVYPPEKKKHPPEYRSVGSVGRILNEFQFVYISEGTGRYRTKTKEFAVKGGVGMFVFPGVWHWYAADLKTGWHEYWFGFKGDYGKTLIENGILSPDNPVIDIGVNSTLVHLFLEMIDIADREPPGFQPKLAGSIIRLLAYSLSFANQKLQGSETEQIVQKARMIMEDNVYGVLDMDELSHRLGISYTQFRALFKNYTGHSPYQYFLHMKINKAKEMLQTGEYSVKEVAIRLAFENQYYFSRLFKKKSGVSPSCWHGYVDE